jgi:oligopeptide transport system substrate-binding protein
VDRPGNLIGNGAYVLKNRVVNEKLEVVPNTHYWDNAKTVLQKVTFLPINQESAATNAILLVILISPNPSRKICTRSC